jgi:hypothetical protein
MREIHETERQEEREAERPAEEAPPAAAGG